MSFVLLHGSGLGRWIWDDVVPRLHGEVRAIDLPGRSDGNNPGEVTVEQAIDFVRGEVRSMKTKPVLVAHSFSGAIALAVAALAPRTVASLVFVSATVAESGKPFLSLMPAPQRFILSLLLKRAKNGIKLPRSAVKHQYCSDLDEAKTALVMARITPEAPRLISDPVDWSLTNVPRLFVKLLDDKSVSLKRQDRAIARVQATRVEELHAGHLAMLSKPAEIAEILNRSLEPVRAVGTDARTV